MKNNHKRNKLAVKVTRKNFNRYIKPYLSVGKRGPEPRISLYKFFNYILHVLYTGSQWTALPIRYRETSTTAVYNRHKRWSSDGSYDNLLEHSVSVLKKEEKLDLSILQGDGSNTVAKKGEKKSAILGINTKKAKKKWL
jgi:transposase